MVYWMIYIKPIPKNIEFFIRDMAKLYENRHGKLPNECHFSHRFTKIDEKIDEIMMIQDKLVPKFQFWFSEAEKQEIKPDLAEEMLSLYMEGVDDGIS